MPIKLLKKSEIDQAKARDRQLEINEGLKLAKKVDTLREVVAQEEESLKKFRIKTISAINDEIIIAAKKRDDLNKENSDLEEKNILLKTERKKLEEPVDLTEAWESVKGREEIIENLSIKNDKWETDYQEKLLLLNKEKARYESDKQTLEILIRKYLKENGKFVSDFEKFEKDRKIFEEYEKIQKESISSRELDVSKREEINSKLEKENSKKENDLMLREKILKDRMEVLERNIKRLNQ